MFARLSNYGHRCNKDSNKDQLANHYSQSTISKLDELKSEIILPYSGQILRNLRKDGLVEALNQIDKKETELRYERNPLEHLEALIFESTTLCNFSCDACYNSTTGIHTESNPKKLTKIVDASVKMGIEWYAFIGGEVSRYGDGWLDVVKHITKTSRNSDIVLISNGWFFLEQKEFTAAGIKYDSVENYLSALKNAGLTHLNLSFDGEGDVHDKSRKRPGLYAALMKGLDQIKSAGMIPRVSVRIENENKVTYPYLADLADKIYDFPKRTRNYKKISRLVNDAENVLSEHIDIGRSAVLNKGDFYLDEASDYVRCKGFFRPQWLTVKANGELATCRLASIGEGYGNINNSDFVSVLNNFQNSFIFKLHAENHLEKYLPLVSREIFGSSFEHPCVVRSIVTELAKEIDKQGIDITDKQALLKVNETVAKYTGHSKNKKNNKKK